MSKKEMLDKAFRDAVTEINVNSIDESLCRKGKC